MAGSRVVRLAGLMSMVRDLSKHEGRLTSKLSRAPCESTLQYPIPKCTCFRLGIGLASYEALGSRRGFRLARTLHTYTTQQGRCQEGCRLQRLVRPPVALCEGLVQLPERIFVIGTPRFVFRLPSCVLISCSFRVATTGYLRFRDRLGDGAPCHARQSQAIMGPRVNAPLPFHRESGAGF